MNKPKEFIFIEFFEDFVKLRGLLGDSFYNKPKKINEYSFREFLRWMEK